MRLFGSSPGEHALARNADLSFEGQQLLERYVNRGWFDAAGDDRLRDDFSRSGFSRSGLPRPAYLVLAAIGAPVPPLSEVQITTRCHYRAFRGLRLVVVSDATRRFELMDLKVMYRSQFRRGERLPLHDCMDEVTPELIQWPLEICRPSLDISVQAIIPARAAEDDPGAVFEMILIGEVF